MKDKKKLFVIVLFCLLILYFFLCNSYRNKYIKNNQLQEDIVVIQEEIEELKLEQINKTQINKLKLQEYENWQRQNQKLVNILQ